MRYIKNFYLIIILLISNTSILNAANIAFIDMDKIINNSEVGKKISNQLKKSHKKSIKNFKETEENLKKKELEITSKKNILSKEDYGNEIKLLREKVREYRNQREESLNKLSTKRVNASKQLIRLIDPIIQQYSSTNSIALIFNKKDVIVGLKELDITNVIMEEVNKKIKNIEIK